MRPRPGGGIRPAAPGVLWLRGEPGGGGPAGAGGAVPAPGEAGGAVPGHEVRGHRRGAKRLRPGGGYAGGTAGKAYGLCNFRHKYPPAAGDYD